MLRFRKPIVFWVAPFLFLALPGCGKGAKVVKVEGTLTYKGKPVPAGIQVDFTPENGRASWGETDDAGHFALEYDRTPKGADVGKHKVSVRRKMTTTGEKEAEMMGKPSKVSGELAGLFEKYSGLNTQNLKVVTIEKETKDLVVNLD